MNEFTRLTLLVQKEGVLPNDAITVGTEFVPNGEYSATTGIRVDTSEEGINFTVIDIGADNKNLVGQVYLEGENRNGEAFLIANAYRAVENKEYKWILCDKWETCGTNADYYSDTNILGLYNEKDDAVFAAEAHKFVLTDFGGEPKEFEQLRIPINEYSAFDEIRAVKLIAVNGSSEENEIHRLYIRKELVR